MKVEDTGLDKGKKQVIQDLSEEYDIEVKILTGWTSRLLYPVHGGGACFNLLVKDPFIILDLDFLKDLPVKSIEHLMLHEIGHKVLFKMNHEEFAERFALKHFSGSIEEYHESWSSKHYHWKTGDSLENTEVGDDLV